MNLRKSMLLFFSLILCFSLFQVVSAHEGHNHVAAANTAGPQEPTKDARCAYCQMVVYTRDQEMGKFTAQMLTADGKTLFFDDSGCMLNYKKTLSAEPQKMWVRDYNSLNWIEVNQAQIVSANISTPMRYGFAFFQNAADADQFVKNNNKLEAMKTDLMFVQKVADKRAEMKKNGQMNMNHGQMAAGVSVAINGQKQSFHQAPVNMHGKVMVNAQELLSKLGATVEFNRTAKTVTAKKAGKSITLPLGHNDMIPLRKACEALGAQVMWDAKTKTVMIHAK
ncbi:MAG: stalk domain-containing protein [Clostridia bacterium]